MVKLREYLLQQREFILRDNAAVLVVEFEQREKKSGDCSCVDATGPSRRDSSTSFR